MKTNRIFLLCIVAAALLFTGCASFIDAMMNSVASSPAPVMLSDPLDGYVFAYVDGMSGDYHVAKILQPAAPSTAEKGELAVGEMVLYQGSGCSDPDADTLRDTTWGAYYITDDSNLFKGEVTINGGSVSIKHLRIPDTEIVTN